MHACPHSSMAHPHNSANKMRRHRISQEEFFCRRSTTFLVDQKTTKKCQANSKLVSLYARRFRKGHWSFIGVGSDKKWYCIIEDSPQGVWDNMAGGMLLEFAENICPICRATSPFFQRSTQKQGTWKIVDTLCSRFGND